MQLVDVLGTWLVGTLAAGCSEATSPRGAAKPRVCGVVPRRLWRSAGVVAFSAVGARKI